MAMTDRQLAEATFKALCAIYYANTGQPLVMDVETTNLDGTTGTVTVNGGTFKKSEPTIINMSFSSGNGLRRSLKQTAQGFANAMRSMQAR